MSPTGTDETQVSTVELAIFTRQLGAMLDAGVDVLRALRIASQHSRNPQLLAAAREIGERLANGREFHEALGPFPHLFDPFYVEMARQGETDGLLGKALLSVADYLDQVSAQRPAEPVAAPAPAGGGAQVAGLTMLILGVQALGAAALWAIATARPEILSLQWTGPLAAFWCAFCLLSGAWILGFIRRAKPLPTAGVTPPPRPAPLPPKSAERKSAETSAVVRNALMEQEEDQENLPRHHLNGHAQPQSDPAQFLPDPDPPRFD